MIFLVNAQGTTKVPSAFLSRYQGMWKRINDTSCVIVLDLDESKGSV